MNAKYIERYEQLIRVLRGLSRHQRTKHFNIQEWGEKTACGTTMCAAGFAGMDPWFRKRGFRFVFDIPERAQGTLIYKNWDGWDSIINFFGPSVSGDAWGSDDEIFSLPKTVGEVIKAAKKRISDLKKEKRETP